MDIHEYQSKSILKEFEINVPEGFLVTKDSSKEQIEKNLKSLGSEVFAVKAQIHAGGRGEAGGVKIVKSAADAMLQAEKMLGMNLVTRQTGPSGQKVRRVYIESGQSIKNEYYLSIIVDRNTSKIAIVASAQGGMEIEEIAKSNPDAIKTVQVDAALGICDFHVRNIAFAIGLEASQVKKIAPVIKKLYKAFVSKDASQLEINPLIENNSGDFIALDAKISFDDSGLFRNKEILELRDKDEEDLLEVEASKYDLNYVKMDGQIGCMVNGAGLAMATMDIIKYYGSDPANFLDVGGGATLEQVTNAFKIISADKKVKGILVNIFGGIMRCDIIASGIIKATQEIGLDMPLVVRLSGTNHELGMQILKDSNLNIKTANDLGEAAQKIVEATK